MVSLFNSIVFIHVACAVIWIGAAVVLEILEWEETRRGARETLEARLHRSAWFGARVFAPSAILTLASGVAAVAIGRPAFNELWVVIALLGIVIVSVIGGAVIGRTNGRLLALLRAHALREDEVETKLAGIRGFVYLDLALLFFILFDMVMRPVSWDPLFFLVSGIFFIIVAGVILSDRHSGKHSPAAR